VKYGFYDVGCSLHTLPWYMTCRFDDWATGLDYKVEISMSCILPRGDCRILQTASSAFEKSFRKVK